MPFTPEERARRSAQARRQHAEGKLGSSAVARRAAARSVEVRQRRASQLAQQLVEQNQTAIEKSLREILKSGTAGQKLKATELLLRMGLSAERLDRDEHRDESQQLSREQLIAVIAEKFQTPAGRMMLGQIQEPVVDAEIVE